MSDVILIKCYWFWEGVNKILSYFYFYWGIRNKDFFYYLFWRNKNFEEKVNEKGRKEVSLEYRLLYICVDFSVENYFGI